MLGTLDEPVVDRVVDDVLERLVVLLLGFDQLRLEASAEDVVDAVVPIVEGAGIAAVQVAHPVREVRQRGLDEQVVVIAHQAAGVNAPAVAALDAAEDVEEGDPVFVVEEDRRAIVPACSYVVMRAGGEVAAWAAHLRRP
jgi:predicted GNAT family acetyltransferase